MIGIIMNQDKFYPFERNSIESTIPKNNIGGMRKGKEYKVRVTRYSDLIEIQFGKYHKKYCNRWDLSVDFGIEWIPKFGRALQNAAVKRALNEGADCYLLVRDQFVRIPGCEVENLIRKIQYSKKRKRELKNMNSDRFR